jgi:hypothetical protein
MSSDVLLSLGQIPTIKLDSWKTINPDGTCRWLVFVPSHAFFSPLLPSPRVGGARHWPLGGPRLVGAKQAAAGC